MLPSQPILLLTAAVIALLASATFVFPQSALESVMRSSGLVCGGTAHFDQDRFLEANAVECKPQLDPLSLPILQQAALMQMHESHVKRAVIARLLVDCQDAPSFPDYRALVALNLSRKALTAKWHRLTPQGVTAAKTLERELCKRFDIHLLIDDHTKAGWQSRYRCCCGWTTSVRRSHTAPGNANHAFNQHLKTKDGIGKVRRYIETIGSMAT